MMIFRNFTDNGSSHLRQKIKQLLTSSYFEYFIIGIIILNSIAIGLETISITNVTFYKLLVAVDSVCIAIFVFEALLKIYALRQHYFKSGWNIFDFIIVVFAVVPAGNFISILRALRIVRAFKLIAHVPALKRVVQALAISIPGIVSTGLLLLLVFFVFAVIGVKLFSPDFPQWFGHLGSALFSLFQIMTLESWSMGIARPIMQVHPYAWCYFVPFILISSFILLNFLIGIVVDAIAHLKHEQENQAKQHSLEHMAMRLDEIERLLKKLCK